MKKKIMIILAVLCIVLVLGCIFVNVRKKVTYKTYFADRTILAENFDKLEEVSELIVRARVLSGKENILVDVPKDQGDILYGYTVTKIEILQSFKGEVAGTPVSITEEYYTTQNMAGTTIWTQGNYLPAKEGGEYIFFLKAYEPGSKYEGMYFPVDLERGKYVVGIPDTFVPEKRGNVSAEILELKGDKDIMEYWKWYEQVAGKYIR